MKFRDLYEIVYGKGAKPFDKETNLAEILNTSIVASIVSNHKNNASEIKLFDIYACLLDKMGLTLDDVFFCMCASCETISADSVLFENFCNNELFNECRETILKLPENMLNKIGIDKEGCKKNLKITYLSLFRLAGYVKHRKLLKAEFNLQSKNLENTEIGELYKKFLTFVCSKNINVYDFNKFIKRMADSLNITIEDVKTARENVLKAVDPILMQSIEEHYKNNPSIVTMPNHLEETKDLQLKSNTEKLKRTVIGQEEATEKILNRLMSALVGFKNENQPIASFLLTGPTGVGKTETAKAIADCYFGGKFFVVDMSTYKNDIDVSRLLGASPNYVGYNDKNGFCDFLKENPNSVILFDEIEKAHPDCLDLLMRILDEGKFINAKGEEISLENCAIFCTTNITASKKATVGFGAKPSMDETVITEDAGLRKETVGRFSEVIEYKKLSKESCKQILQQKFMVKIIEGFKKQNTSNLTLEYTDDLLDLIVAEANTNLFGARDLKKAIQTKFINPITKYIIENNPHDALLKITSLGVKEKSTKKKEVNKVKRQVEEKEQEKEQEIER